MPSLSPVFFSFFPWIEPILDNKVVSQMFNVYLYVAFCHFLNSGKWIFEPWIARQLERLHHHSDDDG